MNKRPVLNGKRFGVGVLGLLPQIAFVLSCFFTTTFHLTTAKAQVALEKRQAYCERGGEHVNAAGVSSTTTVQKSYPQCTVTVFNAGTSTLTSIFADRSGTVKANPFQSDTDGYYSYYVLPGRYDERFSGGTSPNTITTPFTRSDVVVPSSANTAGGITQAYQTIKKDGTNLTQRSTLDISSSTGHSVTDDPTTATTILRSPRLPTGVFNVVDSFNASAIPNEAVGSINAGSPALTVSSLPAGFTIATFFRVGQGVLVSGAGTSGGDFISTISAISGSTLTLTTNAASNSIGTRIQHDETAALQAAINLVQFGNVHIFLPDGGYIVTSPLRFPALVEGRTITIEGSDKAGSTIHYQGLDSLFQQLDATVALDGLEIKNLALATSTPGNYSSVRPTVSQGSAIEFSYSQVVNYPKFTNLRIIGWGRWGIFCANCQGGWFSNIVFRSNAQGHLALVGPETIAQVNAAEANVNSIRDSQFDLAPNITNSDVALTGLSMPSGSYTLTSTTSVFSSAQIGRLIRVVNAGIGGGDLIALVKTYISPTQVTLTAQNQTGSLVFGLSGTLYKSNFGSIYLHRANNTKLSSITIQGNFSGSTRNEFGIRAENSYGLNATNLWIEDTGGGGGHDIELLNAPTSTIIGYKSNADSTASTGNTHGGNIYARGSKGVYVAGMFAENATKHFDLDAGSTLSIESSRLSSPENAFNTYDQSRDRISIGEGVHYFTESVTGFSQRGTVTNYDDPLVNLVTNGNFFDGSGISGWSDTNPSYHAWANGGLTRYNTYQTVNTSALADSGTVNVAFSQVVNVPDNYPSRMWTLGFDLYVQSFGNTAVQNRYVQVMVLASVGGVGYDNFIIQSQNTSNLQLARWERVTYNLFLPSGTSRTFTIRVQTTQGNTTPIVRLGAFKLSPGKHVSGSADQPITENQGGNIRTYLEFTGSSTPPVSLPGRSRIYTTTAGILMCSQNGGAYVPCVGSSSGSSGTLYSTSTVAAFTRQTGTSFVDGDATAGTQNVYLTNSPTGSFAVEVKKRDSTANPINVYWNGGYYSLTVPGSWAKFYPQYGGFGIWARASGGYGLGGSAYEVAGGIVSNNGAATYTRPQNVSFVNADATINAMTITLGASGTRAVEVTKTDSTANTVDIAYGSGTYTFTSTGQYAKFVPDGVGGWILWSLDPTFGGYIGPGTSYALNTNVVYALAPGIGYLACDDTSGTMLVNLGTPTGIPVELLKTAGANSVVINYNSSSFTLPLNGKAVKFVPNESNSAWILWAQN